MPIPEIDLRAILENHTAATFKNEWEAECDFLDSTNEVYDTYVALCEFTLPKIKKLPEQDLKETLEYLETLNPA